MSAANAKRGDRVRYHNALYYFQPNGSACYLFTKEEDLGDISKAAYAPRRDQVTLLLPSELAEYRTTIPDAPELFIRVLDQHTHYFIPDTDAATRVQPILSLDAPRTPALRQPISDDTDGDLLERTRDFIRDLDAQNPVPAPKPLHVSRGEFELFKAQSETRIAALEKLVRTLETLVATLASH